MNQETTGRPYDNLHALNGTQNEMYLTPQDSVWTNRGGERGRASIASQGASQWQLHSDEAIQEGTGFSDEPYSQVLNLTFP